MSNEHLIALGKALLLIADTMLHGLMILAGAVLDVLATIPQDAAMDLIYIGIVGSWIVALLFCIFDTANVKYKKVGK